MPLLSFDWTEFHVVFKTLESPYDKTTIHELEGYRKKLGGSLFIDRVLKAIGITKAKVYPPRNDNGIHALHQQVCAAKISMHQKLSVLYYLLIDYDDVLGAQARNADHFAFRAGLPGVYRIFMRGLWHMDRMQFTAAVQQLTDPALKPEFADDIFTTLARHDDDHDYVLALAYYNAVQPALQTNEALELLCAAKAYTKLTEALWFSRAQPEAVRQQMLNQLVASVLDTSSSVSGENVAARATELVSLPFDATEEAWFEDYLVNGEGRKFKKARDTVLMRKLVTGKQVEVMGDKSLGNRWEAVLQGLNQGMGGRAEV